MNATVAELAEQLGVTPEKLLIACRRLGFAVDNITSEIDITAFNEAVARKKAEQLADEAGLSDEAVAAPAWRDDPTGRHQHRYFDGSTWTDHVADNGLAGEDPFTRPDASGVPIPPTPPSAYKNPAHGQGAHMLITPAEDRPIWKRWWAIAAAVFILLAVVGNLMPDAATDTSTTENAAELTEEEISPTTIASPTTIVSPEVTVPRTVVTRPTTTQKARESVSQSNARRKAESYLDFSSFSRSGLIKQLEFEGFSTADATYGVDALRTDWFDQAVKKAKSYMEYSSFSRQSLIKQLIFEGFSQGEAEHGANGVGY